MIKKPNIVHGYKNYVFNSDTIDGSLRRNEAKQYFKTP